MCNYQILDYNRIIWNTCKQKNRELKQKDKIFREIAPGKETDAPHKNFNSLIIIMLEFLTGH